MENEKTKKASVEKPWLQYHTQEAIQNSLPESTIYQYLWENNKRHLDRVALNYFDKKITYRELFSNINKVSRALLESGVKKDDIVTIAMPTVPETIYLFYALSKIGAIANMVDPRSSQEELEHYADEVHSTLLFTIDQAAIKFKDVKEKTSVREVVQISPADSMPFGLSLGYAAKTFFETTSEQRKASKELHFTKWKEFMDRDTKSYIVEEPKYEKDKPVVIVHTGGTTGVPKGVMLSNDNVNVAAFDCIQSGFDFKREDKWLNIMPPFIAYGIGNGLHMPLLVGMEVILVPQFNPQEFDKLMIKYRPNHMVGVPSHYRDLLQSKRMENKNLSYWKSAIVGGDAMKIDLEKEVNEFLHSHNCSQKIKKGYGMSEVMAGVSACSSDKFNDIGSVGIPFPNSIVAIFDPDTFEELDYGEIGEVCIQTPNMMLGYYKNPEEEAKIMKKHSDGTTWIHSGDLGHMTSDGKIFIEGRMKNMIIRHDGFKVYPKRIEDTILKHHAVEACMVIGIDDDNYVQGKLPKAFVTLKKEASNFNIEGELEILCKKLLPEYSQPIAFEVLNQLPLTKVGKLDYHALEIKEQEKKKVSTIGNKVYQYKIEN